MLYVGTYPQIYPSTILRLGIVSRDGLPRGTHVKSTFQGQEQGEQFESLNDQKCVFE